MFLRLVVFAALVPLASFGQRFQFGVKGGVPLSDTMETGSAYGEGATSATRRYTVGPTVELGLSHGFSVEFDALYRRLGFDDTEYFAPEFTLTRTTAGSWEYPILGKFRFLRRPIMSLYVDGGPAFRGITGVSSTTRQYYGGLGGPFSTTTTFSSATLNNRSSHGVVVGVGADFHTWLPHISPEVRYTRWGTGQNLDSVLQSNPNQLDLLVGLTF
ncbi:MAG TPA: outer membrane beta-barrel protein [Bryobacteraceae bacterium]|nr:outer membrane beta-barrel protein [Bryobacteraceae bacterium]